MAELRLEQAVEAVRQLEARGEAATARAIAQLLGISPDHAGQLVLKGMRRGLIVHCEQGLGYTTPAGRGPRRSAG